MLCHGGISGANAVIVPQHPDMCGEMAECRVPNTKVHGPIVLTLQYQGQTRLVVALIQSMTLISQEWITALARWKLVAEAGQVNVYTQRNPNVPRGLPMRNYLSKELFNEAMKDISKTLNPSRGTISRISMSWPKTKSMEAALVVHAAQIVQPPDLAPIEIIPLAHSDSFTPSRAAVDLAGEFVCLQPKVNSNWSRLSLSRT